MRMKTEIQYDMVSFFWFDNSSYLEVEEVSSRLKDGWEIMNVQLDHKARWIDDDRGRGYACRYYVHFKKSVEIYEDEFKTSVEIKNIEEDKKRT